MTAIVSRAVTAAGGKRTDLDDRYFRSSWEANYARYLNWLLKNKQIKGWEYEPKEFEFPVKKGNRFYTPDFLVHELNDKSNWHEVKGWMNADSKTKLKRFAKYYPEENLILIDKEQYQLIAKQLSRSLRGWE